MSPRVTRSKSAESPTDRTPAKRRKADPALKPSPPSARARAERLSQRDQETPRKPSPPPRSRKPRRAAPVFGVPDDVLAALSEKSAQKKSQPKQKRSSSQPSTSGLQVRTVVLRRRAGRRFKCPVTSCMLCFDSRKELDKHARDDHQEIVECPTCQKRFGNKSALTRHQVVHEQGRATYECSDCDRAFMYPSQLAKHELSHRADVKKFKCHVRRCGAEFKYKGDLNRHLPFHKQVERIVCRFKGCEYSSLSKKKVSEHEHNHLREPDQCKCLCGYTCKWRAQMKKHLDKKQRGCGPKR